MADPIIVTGTPDLDGIGVSASARVPIKYTKDNASIVTMNQGSVWWRTCNPYTLRQHPLDWTDNSNTDGSSYAIGKHTSGVFIYKSEEDCKSDFIDALSNYLIKSQQDGVIFPWSSAFLINNQFLNWRFGIFFTEGGGHVFTDTPYESTISDANIAILQNGLASAILGSDYGWSYVENDVTYTWAEAGVARLFADKPGVTPDLDTQVSNIATITKTFFDTLNLETIFTEHLTHERDIDGAYDLDKVYGEDYAGTKVINLACSFSANDEIPGTFNVKANQDWNNLINKAEIDSTPIRTALTIDLPGIGGESVTIDNLIPANKAAIDESLQSLFVFLILEFVTSGLATESVVATGLGVEAPVGAGVAAGLKVEGRITLGDIMAPVGNLDGVKNNPLMDFSVSYSSPFPTDAVRDATKILSDPKYGINWRLYKQGTSGLSTEEGRATVEFIKQVRKAKTNFPVDATKLDEAFATYNDHIHNVGNSLLGLKLKSASQMQILLDDPEGANALMLLIKQKIEKRLQQENVTDLLNFLNSSHFKTPPPVEIIK